MATCDYAKDETPVCFIKRTLVCVIRTFVQRYSLRRACGYSKLYVGAMKPLCATVHVKTIEQYFHVVMFIMLYK